MNDVSVMTTMPEVRAGTLTSATHTPSSELQRILARLRSWFGADFLCFDGDIGHIIHRPKALPLEDPERLTPLARTLALGGPPRCLAGEGAASLWGLRFECDHRSVVAVSAFLTNLAPVQLADIQAVLGCSPAAALTWSRDRSVWPHHGLESFLQVAASNLASSQTEGELRAEIHGLAENLAHCFEKLTLLHDLSLQLRLDLHPQSFCESILRSLHHCIQAETIAAVWTRDDAVFEVESGRSLGAGELHLAASVLRREGRLEPVVVNRSGDCRDWRSRAVAAHVIDNGKPVGMLLALGRPNAVEFGTNEADLLQNVAGVFGGFLANHRLYTEARELFQGAVQALTSAIDAKDPYTCGHSNRVARMSRCLARALGMPDDECETIYLSGLLHDVGKIGIDERVLRKADRLTPEEFAHVKEHPDLGYRILVNVRPFAPFLPGVRHHHEAWDGSGYPCGLAGEEIPRQAQIIAVADSLDAMTSNRPYRKGMPLERVEKILREGQGTQWAPDVIEAYFRCRDELLEIIQADH